MPYGRSLCLGPVHQATFNRGGNIPNQVRTAAGTVVQERSSTVGRVEGAGGGVAIER